MRSRITSGVLTAGLVLSASVLPASAQTSYPYDDVAADDVHRDAIERATDLDLLQGTGDRSFSPDRSLTRGQAASVLVRTLDAVGAPAPSLSGAPTFSDTGAPHEDAIRRLASAGVIRGFEDGTFRPGRAVTRAQLGALLTRAVSFAADEDLAPEGGDPFTDIEGNPLADEIIVANELGLLLGNEGRFRPGADTRRSQAASVLTRAFDLLDRQSAQARATGEVWALDQGTDLIHIHDGGENLGEVATIDVRPATLAAMGFDRPSGDNTVPHMIEFDSQERYAFVASTAGGVTIVIDTRTKQVVEVLATGPGSHMAAVTPDDSAVWVAVIGGQTMVEIPLDLDAEDPTFAIGRTLEMRDLLAPLEAANGWEYPSDSPVCHQFTTDSSEAWITMGPSWNQGALVVLDLASGELVEEANYDPADVKANCGVSITDDRVVANWSGQVVDGDNTPGETYVLDPDTYDLVDTLPANGNDTHGLRITDDGSEYWQVNRISDNLQVFDADTLEVIAEVDDIAETPDILDFSPDGTLAFITQRGPSPRSGAIHAATGDDPGVAVVDVADRERTRVLTHDRITTEEGTVLNDVHGVGVRTPSVRDVDPASFVQAVPASSSFSTAAIDAPRPEPTGLGGFHCSL